MWLRRAVLLAVTFAALSASAAAAVEDEADYDPWVRAQTQTGEVVARADSANVLVRSTIYLAERAHIESPILRESRGRTDLDLFYQRHYIRPDTPLFVLGRQGSSEVVACTLMNTFVAANMFAQNGRIDARSCLLDLNADGTFDEVRWSPSRTDHHSVHSFHVVAERPPIPISVPYRITLQQYDEGLPPQAHLDLTIAYDPAHRGVIRAAVRSSDGQVVEQDRMNLPQVGARARTLEFFGVSIEVERLDRSSFSWRATRLLPSDVAFTLAYDYRH